MKEIPGVPSVGGYNFPTQPRAEVVRLLPLLKKDSRVLDVGAGLGNNTKFLLENGYSVVATEALREAVDELNTLKLAYPRLEVRSEDVRSMRTNEAYDAVICTMVLHFLNKEETNQTIQDLQSITKIGGYNVIVNYLNDTRLPKEYTYTFDTGELRNFYRDDWEVIFYDESFPAKPLTSNPFKSARIIAKKLR